MIAKDYRVPAEGTHDELFAKYRRNKHSILILKNTAHLFRSISECEWNLITSRCRIRSCDWSETFSGGKNVFGILRSIQKFKDVNYKIWYQSNCSRHELICRAVFSLLFLLIFVFELDCVYKLFRFFGLVQNEFSWSKKCIHFALQSANNNKPTQNKLVPLLPIFCSEIRWNPGLKADKADKTDKS